jgi:predicted permease
MSNFVLIGFCILAGVLFRYRKLVPADAHKGINAWIINLALPAVSFKYLPYINWTSELLIPAFSPIILFIGALLFARLISIKLKPTSANYGVLQLTSGLSNTSFVGFPLIMAYYGEKVLSIAIICDQVTFMLFSVGGIIIALRASGKGAIPLAQAAKKILLFPPFVGCVAALTIPRFIDVAPLSPFFNILANTIAPLALFSIGLQLSFTGWREQLKPIAAVLTYKLVLAPILILSVVLALGYSGIISKIAVFEASMPVLLSVGVLADVYGINPRLANLIIGVSIVLSFITTYVWFNIIEAVL